MGKENIYAYLRVEKLKSDYELTVADKHNSGNIELTGKKQSVLQAFRTMTENITVRSNAVCCLRVKLYFSGGKTPPNIDYNAWAKDNIDFVSRKFGGANNIVHAYLDTRMTEKHPFPTMEAYVIPFDENGKLNARAYTGTKQQLYALIADYAKSMESYGFSSPVPIYEESQKNVNSKSSLKQLVTDAKERSKATQTTIGESKIKNNTKKI